MIVRPAVLKTSLLKRVVFLSLYLAIASSIFTAFAASRVSGGTIDEQTLAVVNLFLLGAATVLSIVIAKRFTQGLSDLSTKVMELAPGHWDFSRTVKSGDEVELLDTVVADLTMRLRDTFGSMEEEISVRTAELRKQSAQDRAILDTIEHGVLLFDAAENITEANPAAERLLLSKSGSLKGKNVVAMLPLRARQRMLTREHHPAVRCLKRRQRFHQRPESHPCIVREDGTLLPILLVVSPLIEKTRCHGGIAVFHDVTEERQLDYMKSEFISLASHQLRTPLSSILWYIELLTDVKGVKMTGEQRSYIKEMHTSAERMSGLIDDLLQVSRLEGEGIRPTKKPVDLQPFLTSIAEDAREQTKAKGISVLFHASGKPMKVHTDATLLSIVMQNVVSNAVKYSKSGGSIEISLKKSSKGAKIAVSVTGIGIPKREQQHLFQKLFRAKNVYKVDATGSGLGLYISKMVMETLGGGIELKSVENKGTVVTVRLPVKGK